MTRSVRRKNLKKAVAKKSCKVGEHADDDDVDVADRVRDRAGEDEEGQRGQHSNRHLLDVGWKEVEENNHTGDIKNNCIKNKYNNLTVHPMSSFLAPRSSRNQKRNAWYKSVKIAEMSWCLNCWWSPRWIPRRPRQTSSSQGTLQPEEENRFAKRMSVSSFNCQFYYDKAQLPLSFSQFAEDLPRSFLPAAWSPVWEENAVIIYVTVVINHVVIMKPVRD